MNIAFILPSLKRVGPTIVAHSIVDSLKKSGHNIEVFYFDSIHELNFDVPTTQISFFKHIDIDRFDIIHTHMLRPDLYVALWYTFMRKSPAKISTVHQLIEHDLKSQHNLFKAFIVSKVWHFALKMMDRVVVLNNIMLSRYQHVLGADNVSKVHNGFAADEFNKNNKGIANDPDLLKMKQKYTCLGVVARLTKNKRIDMIIRALREDSKFALIVVGDGQEKEYLETLAQEYSVNERVYFAGYKKDVASYLRMFDVFVMSSEMEGLPVSMLEAASLKVPCICVDNEVFREFFSSSEVEFFREYDSESLIHAADMVIKNRKQYFQNMLDKINRELSVETMTDNYLTIYKNII